MAPGFVNFNAPIEKHGRGLPHWQQGGAYVFVTWRLGDSLPKDKLEQWRHERDVWLKLHPKLWDKKTQDEYFELFTDRVDVWLEQGSGSCVLKDSAISEVVASALHHFDGERYDFVSFVVMPNHVHELFTLPGLKDGQVFVVSGVGKPRLQVGEPGFRERVFLPARGWGDFAARVVAGVGKPQLRVWRD